MRKNETHTHIKKYFSLRFSHTEMWKIRIQVFPLLSFGQSKGSGGSGVRSPFLEVFIAVQDAIFFYDGGCAFSSSLTRSKTSRGNPRSLQAINSRLELELSTKRMTNAMAKHTDSLARSFT
jgi:hypothetical protein